MEFFKTNKIKRVSSYIEDCYKKLDPKIREVVFKGGLLQAVTAFMSICVMGGSRKPEDCSREDVAKVLSVYIYNALSLSSGKSSDEIAAYLCSKFGQYVRDDKHAKAMISFTMLNQVNPEFSAAKQESVPVIFDNIKNLDVRQQTKTDTSPKTQSVQETTPASHKEYYFANQDEFMIYVAIEKPTEDVHWLSNEKYVEVFKKGYALVDSGNLQDAVAAFNQAISYNPVAIDARFELINCYFGLKQLDAALGSLHYLERYLGRKKDIAHYYRCFGYYYVEIKDYKRGAAAYKLSMDYENSSIAFGEMSAICNSYGVNLNGANIKGLVESGGAAMLSAWFDAILEENNAEEQKQVSNENKTPITNDELRCPACHHILPRDSEFCQYCGTSLITDSTQISTKSSTGNELPNESKGQVFVQEKPAHDSVETAKKEIDNNHNDSDTDVSLDQKKAGDYKSKQDSESVSIGVHSEKQGLSGNQNVKVKTLFLEDSVVKCPNCQKKLGMRLFGYINIKKYPEIKEDVLTEKIFFFECPDCGGKFTVDYPLVYLDPDNSFAIYYSPDADGYNECVDSLELLRNDIRKRVVFNRNDFIEKIRIGESKIDDRIVELAKLVITAGNKDIQIEENTGSIQFYNLQDKGPSIVLNTDNKVRSIIITDQLIDYIRVQYPDFVHDDGHAALVDRHWAATIFKGEKYEDYRLSKSSLELTKNEKCVQAFMNLKPEQKRDFFKGGIKEAAGIIDSFSRILGREIDYYRLLILYITINVRIKMFSYSAVQVRDVLLVRFPELTKDEDRMIYQFVFSHMVDNEYYIVISTQIQHLKNEAQKMNIHNVLRTRLSKPDDSSYGFTQDNPIMQKGLRDAYELLDKLKYEGGEIINYKRLGPVESKMPDIVDCFVLNIKPMDGSEDFSIKLYFDGYAETDPHILPKGFKIKDSTK